MSDIENLFLRGVEALCSVIPASVEVHACHECGHIHIEEDPWIVDGGLPCPVCGNRVEVRNGELGEEPCAGAAQ